MSLFHAASPWRKEAPLRVLVQILDAPDARLGISRHPTPIFSPRARSIRRLGHAPSPFDEMPDRDVVTRTAEMSSLTGSNRGNHALLLFKAMLADGVKPNYVTALCVLRAVGATSSEELCGGVHALVIKFGFTEELPVLTVLIGLYSSLQAVGSVLRLFHQSKSKDLVVRSALVSALSQNGRFTEALGAFGDLLRAGESPNYVSVISILSACAGLGSSLLCRELHGYSIKKFGSERNLQNALADAYAKCKQLDVSIAIFERIPEKDAVSWNTLICRCADRGQPREGLIMFLRMRRSQARPEENVIRVVLIACSQLNELAFALGLHCHIVKTNLCCSVSVGTALLRVFAGFNMVEVARRLFDELRYKDLIAWSAMVSVYAKSGRASLALDTFKRMQLANEEPNEITLVSLLEACALEGLQPHGKSIHAHVLRLGYSLNEYMASAFIDFYCKVGRVKQGKALFDAMESEDFVCWSAMINGYGINGRGEEALETFHEMLKNGLKPNGVVFVCLLSACSHCGLVDEGWRWFYCMEDRFGVCPTLAHYSCVVDMLSRQGQVREALKFIDSMPLAPDVGVWGTLFAGCRAAADDMGVAEIAAGWLMKLDPGNSSYHVALSNLYAELGWWNDVARIRKSMEGKGLRKTVGYSLV